MISKQKKKLFLIWLGSLTLTQSLLLYIGVWEVCIDAIQPWPSNAFNIQEPSIYVQHHLSHSIFIKNKMASSFTLFSPSTSNCITSPVGYYSARNSSFSCSLHFNKPSLNENCMHWLQLSASTEIWNLSVSNVTSKSIN